MKESSAQLPKDSGIHPEPGGDDSLLRCPACHDRLQEKRAASASAAETLACRGCQAEYDVVRGIPRFVKSDSYVKNFSFEWKIHTKTQLDDAKRGSSEKNFYLRLGRPPEFLKGKKVLDVGVGIGRYADVALKAGAEVWGIDLSYSVEAAKANLDHYGKFHAVQANLFELPFPEESFDVIYSFGVLHHTPDPKKAFAGLTKYLKPGGMILVTLYSVHEIYHTSRHFRKLTTKLPSPVLYALTTLMTLVLYYPYRYLRLAYSLLGHYLPISTSPSLKEAILDTFDCYSPKYQFTYTEYEVFTLFKDCGLRDIEVRPQPVTMLGFR
jgi:ubiquinone/menaquinone biosynthesis C-methylase UbiE/uncharacterized protein YbaR (Trm112 family)